MWAGGMVRSSLGRISHECGFMRQGTRAVRVAMATLQIILCIVA